MAGKPTVLITGAGGLGREFARLFHRDGYRLIVVSLLEAELSQLREELVPSGQTQAVQTLAIDLSRPEAAQKVFDHCVEQGLEVEVLVNNAGFGLYGAHAELDPAKVQALLGLNVVTLTELSRLFSREMLTRGSGAILNIASTAGFQPLPFLAAYAASKAYVLSFSQALASELAPAGIKVTCFCPGSTRTKFFETAGLNGSLAGKIGEWVAMSPEKVAGQAYAAFQAGERVAIAGTLNRVVAQLNHYLPNTWITRLFPKIIGH